MEWLAANYCSPRRTGEDMTTTLPGTYRCAKCGEWWDQTHACPMQPAGPADKAHYNAIAANYRPLPDCRTCAKSSERMTGKLECRVAGACVNGSQYQRLPPVRLWRKA